MSRIEKIKLLALNISFNMSLIDSKDLRFEDNDRTKSILRDSLYGTPFHKDFAIKNYLEYYLNKNKEISIIDLRRLYLENKDKIQSIYVHKGIFYYPVNVTCCGSCHTGTSSTTIEEIFEQRGKYNGDFICKRCEENALNISNSNVDKYYFTGTGFYKFDWGYRLMSSDSKGLGFGGSKIILKHNSQGIILTNNLFHITSLSGIFHDKIKDHINTQMFWVRDFSDKTLKEHLTDDEIFSIKSQILEAEKLGLR